jgi:ligand-binding SRPBCC domain-containing protein
MAVVESSVELKAGIDEVFRFISNPKNIERVYPKEMRFRVLEMPDEIGEGSVVKMSARLLGQVFTWHTVIKEFNPPYGFVDEAIDSPFRYWRHTHRVYTVDGRCVMHDRIEFSTILGSIGDRLAIRMISNILEYRNELIRGLFDGEGLDTNTIENRYRIRNPTVISMRNGTILSSVMIALALIIPFFTPYILWAELILLPLAWILLWFFTHDIAHLVVGRMVGIRFSHYYIGLSNIVNAVRLPPRYRLLFVALGLKIDRTNSKNSRLGYTAMYLAGPLASMLTPFYVPIYALTNNHSMEISILLLIASILNLTVGSVMSSKHGCIRKGVRAYTRHS